MVEDECSLLVVCDANAALANTRTRNNGRQWASEGVDGTPARAKYDFTDNFDNGEARVMKGEKTFYIDQHNKVVHQ